MVTRRGIPLPSGPRRILALAALAAAATALLAAAGGNAGAEGTALVGGMRYFFCVLGQVLKVGGLILMRPDAVLIGAIVGGLACGLGI